MKEELKEEKDKTEEAKKENEDLKKKMEETPAQSEAPASSENEDRIKVCTHPTVCKLWQLLTMY